MMFTLLLVSLAALFGSIFMLSLSTTMAVSNRVLVKGSIKRLDVYGGELTAVQDELSKPFFDRIIIPLVRMFTAVGKKLTPAGFLHNIKHRLVLSGVAKEFDTDRFLAYKGFCLIGGLVLASLILLAGHGGLFMLGAIGVAASSFFLPDLWLKQKIDARQKAVRLALPDTLDLLTISVEAGLGFDAALHKVVRNTTGPLSEEFYRLLQEIQLGTARSEAFRNLGERTQVDELGSFILAMLQAEVFGISIGKVLRVQARELRIKRRQRAEETAQKAPVKIIFPLVTCIFPAVLVIIMGPAVIQIYETIFKSF